jgi:hypothetical protein
MDLTLSTLYDAGSAIHDGLRHGYTYISTLHLFSPLTQKEKEREEIKSQKEITPEGNN